MATDQTYEQWDIVSSVGITALGVALGRALETKSEHGLVHDPYAERFVRAAAPEGDFLSVLEGRSEDPDTNDLWTAMTAHLGLRSRFFDEYFGRASSDGMRQAVLLASGLDVRAYRLDWPDNFHLFEIDQPLVLDFKDRVLAEAGATSRCQREAVRVDLREDWRGALLEAGFDPEAPTAWLAEGLLPYLPPEAERKLIETMTALSAPGSYIALEHAHRTPDAFNNPFFGRVSDRFGVDMRQLVYLDDRPSALSTFASLGWNIDRDEDGSAMAKRYGRELHGPAAELLDHVQYANAHLD